MYFYNNERPKQEGAPSARAMDTTTDFHIQTGFFASSDGRRLRYLESRQDASTNALIILGGRTEYLEKYHEVFDDLSSLEATIYSYDHRGQGLSERLLADPHKGYVEKFQDYVEDLRVFLSSIVAENHRNIYLLAHSMGCTVATLFQRQYPGTVQAAVLCSPMFGINVFPLPFMAARWLAAAAVEQGRGEKYLPMGGRYRKIWFVGNRLTSCRWRFLRNQELVDCHPELALGSPTYNWLHESFGAMETIMEEAANIDIPLLLLQGSRDFVVINSSHHRFARRCSDCRVLTIKGGRHELLMEQDARRQQALTAVTAFYARHGLKQRFPETK